MAQLLENQEVDSRRQNLMEAPNSVASNVSGYDPILIQLVRRAMPNLMAYDICGVQAMNAPTGLIFAMRSKYGSGTGVDAFYDEATTKYALDGGVTLANNSSDPFANYPGDTTLAGMGLSGGDSTATAENTTPKQMAFNIEKVTVTALSRTLAASYSIELAQDLKAIHGLDAESELSNILSTEILAEINREVVRTVYNSAVLGCQQTDLFYKTAGSTAAGAGLSLGSGAAALVGGI